MGFPIHFYIDLTPWVLANIRPFWKILWMIALINLFEANKIARFYKYLAKSSDWDSLMLQAMWCDMFIFMSFIQLQAIWVVYSMSEKYAFLSINIDIVDKIPSGYVQGSFCECALAMRDNGIIKSSFIGWAHAQNDPCMFMMVKISHAWCNMIIFLQIDCFQTKRKTGEGKTGEETRLREKENQEEALIQVQFNL